MLGGTAQVQRRQCRGSLSAQAALRSETCWVNGIDPDTPAVSILKINPFVLAVVWTHVLSLFPRVLCYFFGGFFLGFYHGLACYWFFSRIL